ncbi:MAG: agmatinase [Candidatus Woesearchaeota archaeon]|nr:agmatinase [Candidatus Woesearchaeota archaeon]
MRFMNMPEEYSRKSSRFKIIPVEYEGKPTWGRGAIRGSEKILDSSYNLEYYDEQFDKEPFLLGIETLEKMRLKGASEGEAIEKISKRISEIHKKGTDFPIIIGGDHTVTLGVTLGMEKSGEDFSVIVLDAHSDMRESWNNSRFNHACVSKRMQEKHKILIIGLRAQDVDEMEFMKNSGNVSAIRAYEYSRKKLLTELSRLGKNVYLSIDADFFDPSFIRNTGTPEPGGFFWNETIEILSEIFSRKNVIAADITEFAPANNYRAEAFSLAKLCHKMMAMKMTDENFK